MTPSRTRRGSLVVLCLATSVTVAPARAEMPPEARQLYQQGKVELQAHLYDAAVASFKRAIPLVEPGSTDLWLLLLATALGYEQSGAPGYAIEYYERFMAQTDPHVSALDAKWKTRRKVVTRALGANRQRALREGGYVRVVSEPTGAAVLLDGARAGADADAVTPAGLFLPPGSHRVTCVLPGHAPGARDVVVRVGQSTELTIALLPEQEPELESTGERDPELTTHALTAPQLPEADSPGTGPEPGEVPVAPWLVAGGGGLLLASGAVMTVLAVRDRDAMSALSTPDPELGVDAGRKRWDELDDAREAKVTASWALYAIGGAALVGGVVWGLVALGPSEGATLRVGLLPTRGGGVATISVGAPYVPWAPTAKGPASPGR